MLSEQTRALAEALAETSDEAIVLVSPEGVPYFARGGDPVAEIVKRTPHEILDDPDALLYDAELLRVKDAYRRLVNTPGRRDATSFWIRHPSGSMVQLRAMGANKVTEELGAILIRVSVVASKPALKKFTAADTDPPDHEGHDAEPEVTSWRGGTLLSRGEFLEMLQRVVDRKEEKIWGAPSYARSIAKDRRYDYAVVLMEIDRSDMLRGNFAQEAIEHTVMDVAARLSTALRGRDAVGYLGGTEVAILVDGVSDVQHAIRVTDEYLALMADPFAVDDQPVTLSPALGIATSERRYSNAEDVLRDATAAVMRSLKKKRGTRRMAFDTAMRLEDKKNLALMSDLHSAFEREELWLAFQPIIRLGDGALAGFEALARWTHPTHGAIQPAEFIPLAEEMGYMRDLGRWVLERACGALAKWCGEDLELTSLIMCVNVSPLQLLDPHFGRDLAAVLDRYGIAPAQLGLDITEGAIMQDPELAAQAVKALVRDIGVSFALDDFGTGYSSLSLLHQLPYGYLKIDRALIQEATRTGEQQKVLTAIVRMAQALSMTVIAEGVESEEQRMALTQVGCDLAQGFLFALPMDEEAAAALLRTNPRW